MSKAAPVVASERIVAIDVLRGFALLGILLMNIQSFSMISAAYFNPTTSGFFDGVDRWIWIVAHVVADQKFMTLFSLLFGAGILLMTAKADRAGASPARLHYRRTFWLIVIGAAHAYLLWFGDVLVWYGLCALVVYWFRNVRPWVLALVGVVAIDVGAMLTFQLGVVMPQLPPEERAEFMNDWEPDEATVTAEMSAYRGSWREQLNHRVPTALMMHTVVFLAFSFWRAGGLMLLGMALFKWGVLSGERSMSLYRKAVLVGVAGLALVGYGVYTDMAAGFAFEYSRFFGYQYNYWGSLLVSAGYIGVVMLWCRSRVLGVLKSALGAVGRMAFTNYILQTVLCTAIFYGHGLGRFMMADRIEQTLVVLGVWVVQLVVSPIWLRHFRFGPLEWLWRSLTYMERQPFRVVFD